MGVQFCTKSGKFAMISPERGNLHELEVLDEPSGMHNFTSSLDPWRNANGNGEKKFVFARRVIHRDREEDETAAIDDKFDSQVSTEYRPCLSGDKTPEIPPTTITTSSSGTIANMLEDPRWMDDVSDDEDNTEDRKDTETYTTIPTTQPTMDGVRNRHRTTRRLPWINRDLRRFERPLRLRRWL